MTIPVELVSILLTAAVGMSITGIYQLIAIASAVKSFQEWKKNHLEITEDIVHRIDDLMMRVLKIEVWITADERATGRDMDVVKEVKKELEQMRTYLFEKTYVGNK